MKRGTGARGHRGTVLAALVVCGAAVPRCLGAAAFQCPDGTPPPCAAAPRRAAVQPPAEAERRRHLLVLPFRNISRGAADEWIVEGSTTMLAEALGRWRDLAVVDDQRLYPALRRQGVVPGTVAEAARVRRVAEETGGWTVITGELVRSGGRLRLTARAEDVVSRRVLVARATAENAVDADVREAFERLAAALVSGVAGLGDAGADARPGTRSLEAYRAYLSGVTHVNRLRVRQARAAFQEAVRLDSSYAGAWLGLAQSSARSLAEVFNPTSTLYRAAEQAQRHAASLREREQRLVRGIAAFTRSQFAAAREQLDALVAADSADLDALEWLAAVELFDWVTVRDSTAAVRLRGSPQRAARLAQRAVNLDPGRAQAHEVLAITQGLAAGLWTGGIVWGARRESNTFAAFLTGESDGLFRMVLRGDTLGYVLDDPKSPDTVTAAERVRAVAAFRSVTARWQLATPGMGEAQLLAARAHELAGALDSALLALRAADSLGVETTLEVPAARRLVILGRLSRFPEARRLADSLHDAGYFRGLPLRTPFLSDPSSWAVQLFLLEGDTVRLAALFDAYQPRTVHYAACYGMPSRGFTRTVTDSVRLAVARAWLARGAVGAGSRRANECFREVLSVLRPLADAERSPIGEALVSGLRSALAAGDTARAVWHFHVAGYLDTALARRVREADWFAPVRADAERRRRETEARVSPLGAEVAGNTVTVRWRLDAGAPLTWNRVNTPPYTVEHRFVARFAFGDELWLLSVARFHEPFAAPESGTIDAVLRGRSAYLMTGPGDDSLRTVQGANLRVEVAGDTVRLVASHPGLASRLREARLATVDMLFVPCVERRLPDGQCGRVERPIVYRQVP